MALDLPRQLLVLLLRPTARSSPRSTAVCRYFPSLLRVCARGRNGPRCGQGHRAGRAAGLPLQPLESWRDRSRARGAQDLARGQDAKDHCLEPSPDSPDDDAADARPEEHDRLMDFIDTLLWPFRQVVSWSSGPSTSSSPGWGWTRTPAGPGRCPSSSWCWCPHRPDSGLRQADPGPARGCRPMQPDLQKLQAKYKGKRTRLRSRPWRRRARTLQEHRTNPLSSCLPILIQMPFFFALFKLLNNSRPTRGPPARAIGAFPRSTCAASRTPHLRRPAVDTFLGTSAPAPQRLGPHRGLAHDRRYDRLAVHHAEAADAKNMPRRRSTAPSRSSRR